LALVRAIAEAHGGTASAANAQDGGAKITVVVPGAAPPDQNERRRH
jgi:signal transduction histidine kinase